MKLEDIKVGEVYIARWREGRVWREGMFKVNTIDGGSRWPIRGMLIDNRGVMIRLWCADPEELHYLSSVPFGHIR